MKDDNIKYNDLGQIILEHLMQITEKTSNVQQSLEVHITEEHHNLHELRVSVADIKQELTLLQEEVTLLARKVRIVESVRGVFRWLKLPLIIITTAILTAFAEDVWRIIKNIFTWIISL